MGGRRILYALAVLAASAAWASACVGDDPEPARATAGERGGPCADGRCLAGLSCVDGVCVTLGENALDASDDTRSRPSREDAATEPPARQPDHDAAACPTPPSPAAAIACPGTDSCSANAGDMCCFHDDGGASCQGSCRDGSATQCVTSATCASGKVCCARVTAPTGEFVCPGTLKDYRGTSCNNRCSVPGQIQLCAAGDECPAGTTCRTVDILTPTGPITVGACVL